MFELIQILFGINIPKYHSDVRQHGIVKSSPRKGNLFHGREGATSNDRKKRGPDVKRIRLFENTLGQYH